MDPKTKVLIGLLVIVIILISGWWVWSNQILKSIYIKGEPVKFRIDDTVQICTNGLAFSIIKPNGEYVNLRHSCMGIVGSGFDQYCENGQVVSKRVYQLCSFSGEIYCGCSDAITCWNESIHETIIWNQKEYIEITEECENKTIRREILEQVPEGKYQIIVNGNVIKEFTIK